MHAKRLLFIGGGTFVYGLERVVLKLVEGLVGRGFDVRCTVSGWNDGDYPKALARIGVPYQEIYLGWLYRQHPRWTFESLRRAPSAFLAYQRLLQAFRPDLVFHSSYRSLAQLGWLIGRKNVMMIHDYWHKSWETALVKLLDRQVRTYVALSNEMRGRLVTAGLPAGKIKRISNPADFGTTLRQVRPSQIRTVPTLGIVGQIIERKGHHVAIEALALVRKRCPELDFCLKIFGAGPDDYVTRIKALAAARGVAPRIAWCGYKAHADEIFPEVDFTLLPATEPDPLPLAAIEPAVYGKPVIASATGGLPEILRDGITGFLVPPGDASVLADRILQLIKEPALARTLGQQAYADYRRRFDSSVFVEQYCRVIEGLLEGGSC